MSWASRRRSTYLLLVIVTITVIVVPIIYFVVNKPPTCSDGKQNGTESGVDCGGICNKLCLEETLNTVLIWSRSFKVADGIYNAVAYVENPNSNASIPKISYSFKLFDDNNFIITERKGSTFIAPNGISPIFEGGIRTGEKIPAKTFFEFTETPEWFKTGLVEEPLTISNTVLSNEDSAPRINTVISNDSISDEYNIEVVAVIFDVRDNAIAVSSTYVDLLPSRTSKSVVFTWPTRLDKKLEACTAPVDVVLLLDTSGSMNDDSSDPPQPITDAKKAAQDFVLRLTDLDRSGLVTFATNSNLKQKFTSQHDVTKSTIASIEILPEEETGSTNIGDGIKDAIEELKLENTSLTERQASKLRKVIVLLTDGKANVPVDPGGEIHALEQANVAKGNNIDIYTIGLGGKINSTFLKKVASKNEDSNIEQFYKATDSGELTHIYSQISEAICERGPAVIEILPRIHGTSIE